MIRDSLTNQVAQIEALRALAITYGEAIEELLPARERSLALTHLENSVMWAVKSIILNGA